jgi:hypothetical protein
MTSILSLLTSPTQSSGSGSGFTYSTVILSPSRQTHVEIHSGNRVGDVVVGSLVVGSLVGGRGVGDGVSILPLGFLMSEGAAGAVVSGGDVIGGSVFGGFVLGGREVGIGGFGVEVGCTGENVI